MILLKQIPQHAVINNQDKVQSEDPEWDWTLSGPHICHSARGNLEEHCTLSLTHPPGQRRRKLTGVNIVSRGRNQCHASKPHKTNNTTPGPEPNLKGFYKDANPDWAEKFFQMLPCQWLQWALYHIDTESASVTEITPQMYGSIWKSLNFCKNQISTGPQHPAAHTQTHYKRKG